MGKKAVLIGINYPGTQSQLNGCVNDVHRMYQCLVDRYGFSEDDITVLIDTDDSYQQPTGRNIRAAIENLVSSAEPGDTLFVHYSGHGTRVPAETGDDDDTGYDECIVPCDMNLIADDDFREFVDRVPEGCRLTMVSDSCHSGGLIDEAKEQIGDSTKQGGEDGDGGGGFSVRGFIKKAAKEAFETYREHHSHRERKACEETDVDGVPVKSRYLPLSTLIGMLKEKTGKDDVDVGKLRLTLFDAFGNDASPKVKKFTKVIIGKLDGGGKTRGEDRGLLGFVGDLAQKFLQERMDGNEDYSKPAMEAHLESDAEAYAGSTRKGLPDGGILISGCQTDQTSADASPPGKPSEAFGALSNAIQSILAEEGNVSNRELVMKARKMLSKQGFSQRPGLYCSDDHVGASFLC